MIRRIFLGVCLLGTFAFASQAAAQDGPVPEATRDGGDGGATTFKKETVYDFDDDVVEGNLIKPDGALVGGELHGKRSSLIKIRADFIPEMLKSVEDL